MITIKMNKSNDARASKIYLMELKKRKFHWDLIEKQYWVENLSTQTLLN